MLIPFDNEIIRLLDDRSFMDGVAKKYHYDESQIMDLYSVARTMKSTIQGDLEQGKAGWVDEIGLRKPAKPNVDEKSIIACITLGSGLDLLQDKYRADGNYLMEYMVETIASDLLMMAYPRWNEMVSKVYGRDLKRYHFYGSETDYPMEATTYALDKLGNPVDCTSGYCLIPKKSVIFAAELAAAGEKAQCEGICVYCKNDKCPNHFAG